MTLIPLIIVTTVVEILFFSIRVWAIRKKGHSRGYDDISISIAFVSASINRSPAPGFSLVAMSYS